MTTKPKLPTDAQLKNRLETSFASFRTKMLASTDSERHMNYVMAIGMLSAMYSANLINELVMDERVEALGKEL